MSLLFYLAIALVAGALSVGRILATNPDALQTLVWAEDGLFPLCISQHGYVSCLIDPFAGYFLFLSRTLAAPVTWFPLDQWAYASNLVAAVAVGAGSALIAWAAVRSGMSRVTTAIIAVIPVVIPIAGFEAVNASGSTYMILLIAVSFIASMPVIRTIPVWALMMLLLVTSLTIPSSIVLVLPLAFTLLVLGRNPRRFLAATAALLVGFGVQVFTTLTTDNPRPVSVNLESLSGWVLGIPIAARTLWPGDVVLGPTGVLETPTMNVSTSAWWLIGIVLAGSIFLTALGTRRQDPLLAGIGVFTVTGLLLSAVPAVAGFANNRYYVIPITIAAIAVTLLFTRIPLIPESASASAMGIALLLLWSPGFPAGQYRATASPLWPDMLAAARAQCSTGAQEVPLTFSPNWPFADAVFPGVTSQRIRCASLTQ